MRHALARSARRSSIWGNRINTALLRSHGRLLFHAVVGLFFLTLVALHYDAKTGFTSLIQFGDQFESRQLPDIARTQPFVHVRSSGYDGQFYAQIAAHPGLDAPALGAALDSPAYRSRRIGLPLIAWIAGAGDTSRILQAYALANVIAWMALAVLLLRWIPPADATAAIAWLGCVFGIGVIMSADRALTDLPCALLIAIAIALAERGRKFAATATLALSCLTRDTSVLATGLLFPLRCIRFSSWLAAGLLAVAAALPLAFWAIHVQRRFPGTASVDPANFGLPFAAMLGSLSASWHAVPRDGWALFVAQLASTIALTTQFVFLMIAARRCWQDRWWRVGWPFAFLFAVLGPAVWQDYPAAARAVIPMTLAFNILLVRSSHWRLPVCILGNLTILHGVAYLFASIPAARP